MTAGYTPVEGDVVRLVDLDGLWRISHLGGPDQYALYRVDGGRYVRERMVSATAAQIRQTVTTLVERRLGRRQMVVLAHLRSGGIWPSGGWTHRNAWTTRQVVESLARKGLAERGRGPYWRATEPAEVPV